MKTRITCLLAIEHPIIQARMRRASSALLAAELNQSLQRMRNR